MRFNDFDDVGAERQICFFRIPVLMEQFYGFLRRLQYEPLGHRGAVSQMRQLIVGKSVEALCATGIERGVLVLDVSDRHHEIVGWRK